MKELIIKVDDPGERVWDGSPKTFEIRELVRCKDCKHIEISPSGLMKCNNVFRSPDWFCADGVAKDINVPDKEGR